MRCRVSSQPCTHLGSGRRPDNYARRAKFSVRTRARSMEPVVTETVEIDESTGSERRVITTVEIVVGPDGKKKRRTLTKTITTPAAAKPASAR